MKKIVLAMLALAAVAVFADDPEPLALADANLAPSGIGFKTIKVGEPGRVITALPFDVEKFSIIPWRIEVTNATKTVTTSETETIYTNFVCAATITNTIQRPVFDTNGAVAGLTNIVSVSIVTNNFSTMPGAPWSMVSRAGYEVTNSVTAKVPCGGTLRVYNTEGDGWGTSTITGGSSAKREVLNMGRIGFYGTMRVEATEAEEAEIKLFYLMMR